MTGDSDNDWRTINKRRWDERVPLHAKSSLYDVDGFLAGDLTLGDEEVQEMGDVRGKSLLHLQCHFGLDTLSWARLGAQVTGLDFSNPAIDLANELAAKAGLKANFITGDLYDTPNLIKEQFDILYTGIGALCWLPDIKGWADIIARMLKPGGKLYLIEIHPVEWIFGEEFDVAYDYFSPQSGLKFHQEGSYTDTDAATTHNDGVNWNHSIGDVTTALIKAGLTINEIQESPECPFMRWPMMERVGRSRYKLPDRYPSLPLTYRLQATKTD